MADQRLIILWLNAVLIAFTLCAVISRAGRKIFVIKKFGWHDALIVVAAVSISIPTHTGYPLTNSQVSATIFSIFQMVSTGLGLGDHQVNANPANMPELRKVRYSSVRTRWTIH